jgi:hypothetical protein
LNFFGTKEPLNHDFWLSHTNSEFKNGSAFFKHSQRTGIFMNYNKQRSANFTDGFLIGSYTL